MVRGTLFTGQPVFNQLLNLLPQGLVRSAARKHNSDYYFKKFKSSDHLITMLYASFHNCTSLRELITGILACSTKMNHLGLGCFPRRSTLSDANAVRKEGFFSEVYYQLYHAYFPGLPDSRKKKSLESRLFIVDSTVIELFSEIFKGNGMKNGNGKSKGGVKAHVLMNALEDVPCFVNITPASHHDVEFMYKIILPPGSIVTFDKGYHGFKPLQDWDEQGTTWVTRLKVNGAYTVLAQRIVSQAEMAKGILSDTKIILGNRNVKNRPMARKIDYLDPDSGKQLVFITNNQKMLPSTITRIYKKRWQIETLFKRLKQNYPLKYFLGDNQNAIKIQIWCALITDLLVKIVKSRIKRKWSYANISGMIRLHLMTYIDLFRFLQDPEKALKNYVLPATQIQPSLFIT